MIYTNKYIVILVQIQIHGLINFEKMKNKLKSFSNLKEK